jgi:hypothetical protein
MEMYAIQSEGNLDLLLAGDNNELLSTDNCSQKKINFSTTSYTSQQSMTLLFATGNINSSRQFIKPDTTSITNMIFPLATFEFGVNFKINVVDHVFVGSNTGSGSFKLNIAGIDNNPSYSYCWSVL